MLWRGGHPRKELGPGKISEVRGIKTDELSKQLDTAKKELLSIRFRLATKQLVNHREIRRVKKDIALLNTVIRERELGIRQD